MPISVPMSCRVRRSSLWLLGLVACSAPDDALTPAQESLGRRIDSLGAHFAPTQFSENMARRGAKVASDLGSLPASELERLPAFSRAGERALDSVANDLRCLKGLAPRVSSLLGIDRTPFPDPSDPDRLTNPFEETKRASIWTRILGRFGF